MNEAYDTSEWAVETTLGRRIFNANFRLGATRAARLGGRQLRSRGAGGRGHRARHHLAQERRQAGDADPGRRRRIRQLERRSNRACTPPCFTACVPTFRGERRTCPDGRCQLCRVRYQGQGCGIGILLAWECGRLGGQRRRSTCRRGDVRQEGGCRLAYAAQGNRAQAWPGRARSPRSYDVKRRRPVTVIESLPQVLAAGLGQGHRPDGELRREDDHLVYVAEGAGRKRVGHYLYGGTR